MKQLHAQFHQEAAKVVELVTAGQMEAANKLMDIGGSFAKSTTALTEAMVKWRESLH